MAAQGLSRVGIHVHLSQDCQELPARPPPGPGTASQERGRDGPAGWGLLLGQSVVPSWQLGAVPTKQMLPW